MKKDTGIKLMIVEDEQALRYGLASLPWEEQGITMLPPAKNGLEAMKLARQEQVDILLTDIRMPGPSGLEVAECIREWYPNAQILFLSGYGEFEYARKAISLRACDYILKPSTPREILAAVNKAKEKVLSHRSEDVSHQKMQQQINHLSKMVAASTMVEQQRSRDLPHEEDIVKIVSYIGEHYQETLTLDSLAEVFHFNSAYLSRFIKKKSGHTFTELLTSARMYHAARLLKETTLKNGEICTRIGMSDERYFSQVFQRAYGISPYEYRKSNRRMDQDLMSILMGEKA